MQKNVRKYKHIHTPHTHTHSDIYIIILNPKNNIKKEEKEGVLGDKKEAQDIGKKKIQKYIQRAR